MPLENEINNALSKETDWNRLKTEKQEASHNDALRKFRTELMGGQVTIDINQLKLDLNIDAHLKNRVIKNSNNAGGTFQEQKQGQTIKSGSQHSGGSSKNNKANVFYFFLFFKDHEHSFFNKLGDFPFST